MLVCPEIVALIWHNNLSYKKREFFTKSESALIFKTIQFIPKMTGYDDLKKEISKVKSGL